MSNSQTEEHPSAAGVRVKNRRSQSNTNGTAGGMGEEQRDVTPEQRAVVQRIRSCKQSAYYEIDQQVHMVHPWILTSRQSEILLKLMNHPAGDWYVTICPCLLISLIKLAIFVASGSTSVTDSRTLVATNQTEFTLDALPTR